MKIYSSYLNLKMELTDTGTNILVLESPKIYRETIQNLLLSLEEENEDWIFSDNENIVKKNKSLDIIHSLFSLNFDSRKIQKAVIDELYGIAVNEDNYEKTSNLMSNLETYLYELEWQTQYNLRIALDDFHNILKAGVLEIASSDNLVERLDEYIKISARLLKTKVLILVGFQGFFREEEWKQIEKAARNEELILLCIEKELVFESENKIVIDNDVCRVV